MFRLEECRQQGVDSQQTGAGQPDPVAVDRQESFVGILLPNVAPLSENFDAEFAAEIAGVELAGLELQDHLAHQQLMRRRPHAAPQRQLAPIERPDIAAANRADSDNARPRRGQSWPRRWPTDRCRATDCRGS